MKNLRKLINFSTLESSLTHSKSSILSFSKLTLNKKTHQLSNLLHSLHQITTALHHKQIHAQIVVSNFKDDIFLCNLLLRGYSKSGPLCYARQLFDEMPQRNLVSWSSLISMYSQHGFVEDCFLVFLELRRCCVESPNGYVLSSVLRACIELGSVGQQVHGFVVKCGFGVDVFVGTSLVDFYAKRGEVDIAQRVFDELVERSAVTWTAIIMGYVKCGRCKVSLELFKQMVETGEVVPDRYVFCSVLSVCSMLEFADGGKQIHGYVLRRGVAMDVSVANVLIDLYVKCGDVEKGCKVFDQMVDRNVISWTTMIAGYMQNSMDREALRLFVEMTMLGWKPDAFVCTSILTSCGSLVALGLGKQVHAYSVRTNLLDDVFLQNGLIDMYAKCYSLLYARQVFELMSEHNVVSYNALIEGYSRDEQLLEALNIFCRLRLRVFQPSILTLVSLLGVSAALSELGLSKQIHALIINFGIALETFAGSALIDVYAKCSCTTDARLVFDELVDKDIVIWNAMLFGYAQQSENEHALKLYCELQLSEQKPNSFTCAAVIAAAANLSSLQHGWQFHNHVIRMGLEQEPVVKNSLIDMYAKCGRPEDAEKTFSSAVWKDVVCWNSMISAYAYHGEANEALCLFNKMVDQGIEPNYVTFVNVLSACNHSGLVEDGLHHFESMARFGIEPGIEHYACVASLLSRAGQLYKAKDFIQKMPMQPTAAIWRSLLSACRVSGNVEVAKYAAEMALSIDPTDSSSYTLLSSILASKEMWEEAKSVRKGMDVDGIVKEAGQSWVV